MAEAIIGAHGPMESLAGVRGGAQLFDADLRSGRITMDRRQAQEMADALEYGLELIGTEVTIYGRSLVPYVDEDGDEAGVEFSEAATSSTGEYLGLLAVPVDIRVAGEPTGLKEIRIVHLLKMQSATYLDRFTGAQIKRTEVERFEIDAQITPQSVYHAHSLLYLTDDKEAARVCEEIDIAAFDEALEAAERVERIIALMNSMMGLIIENHERYRNVLSYLNSLDVLRGIVALAPYGIHFGDGYTSYATSPTGSRIYQDLLGFEVGQRSKVTNGEFETLNRRALYVAAVNKRGELIYLPAAESAFAAQ